MNHSVNEIWVIVEQTLGEIRPVSFEVLHAAKQLAKQSQSTVIAYCLCDQSPRDLDSMLKHGADRVQLLKNPQLARFHTEAYLSALLPYIKVQSPKAVLLAATAHGKELASALTASIVGGLATDCISLQFENEKLHVRRPVYGGRAISNIRFKDGVIPVITLRPNIFRGFSGPDSSQGIIDEQCPDIGTLATKIRELVKDVGASVDITEARVLVSGGLGMQNLENFALLEKLAEVLGGAVGASRPVVDNGWRKYSNQVGQTGRTVSPDLYIACGISGAVQHLAGMSSSKCIVAINKDPNAPIFSVCDYGIVGDVLQILPILTETFRKALVA